MKTCPKCPKPKPLSEFTKDRSRSDGLSRLCRLHKNAEKALWRAANRDHVNASKRRDWAAHADTINATRRARYAANPAPINARNRAYYATHPEQAAAQVRHYRATHPGVKAAESRRYRANHPDRSKAYQQRRHAEHPEEARRRSQRWRLVNPEKVSARHKRSRARRANAPINDLTAQDWREILSAFRWRCAYCGKPLTLKTATQDHVTPASQDGPYTKANIVPACKPCNSRKHIGPPLLPVQPLLI